MKERNQHPLRNVELAWTEELPIPSVSYDLSLANEPYEVEFDIKRYSQYLIDQKVNSRRARSLSVKLTKEKPKEPNKLGMYNPSLNEMEIYCRSIWRHGGADVNQYTAQVVSHETRHVKDRLFPFAYLAGGAMIFTPLMVAARRLLFDHDLITDNDLLNSGILLSLDASAVFAAYKYLPAATLSAYEKRAYAAQVSNASTNGILTFYPKHENDL